MRNKKLPIEIIKYLEKLDEHLENSKMLTKKMEDLAIDLALLVEKKLKARLDD